MESRRSNQIDEVVNLRKSKNLDEDVEESLAEKFKKRQQEMDEVHRIEREEKERIEREKKEALEAKLLKIK